MAKYRKRPVVVEAEVYKPGMEDGFACSKEEHAQCIFDQFSLEKCSWCCLCRPYINTLEGPLFISPGDYIITGVKGERYPCKPDVFEKTYEPVIDIKGLR